MTTYFLSYFYDAGKGVQGWGNIQVNRSTPVQAYADVKAMEKEVASFTGYKHVLIINWRPFENAPEPQAQTPAATPPNT